MAQAQRHDCEATAADCRFVIRSENEDEAIELLKIHMRDVHRKDCTDDELRRKRLQLV
ncbi:hypothetical protein Htur_4242 (plasmid) [Haloterrigena turkmenica DSM 5511]|uniref:DUF1059 domain-containing protein n=1 Tax=Haloterrigena turkmenica (strain ATCC 51198 / DSM 5511 / JCM 9101 / NCIMB 13204 / VKM B-1734 / 4k) TaxID=543526 RepID=D2S114_HALTV|nr:hypothetical protein Htur_4242 [Haloterrigena turkmenica DSM 5511]